MDVSLVAKGPAMESSAVIFDREPRGARFVRIEVPALGPDDVLVRSKVVGLCRSDIELLEGHLDEQLAVSYPIVPGHEWSGEVMEVGASVTKVAPGAPVVGECVLAANHWFGFTYNGAAAETFVVPSRLLHELPASLSYEQGALVEPFTIAYRAIRDTVRAGGRALNGRSDGRGRAQRQPPRPRPAHGG